jgi:uncharacterized SAM-binding protein YcdF (DUF218 family)
LDEDSVFETDLSLFLTKLLPILVYPVGATVWLTLLGTVLMLLGYRKTGGSIAVFAALLLWACSTPIVAEHVAGALERQYPARSMAETATADVAIVLGGGVRPPTPPRLDADLADAGDRVVHAARLYRAGKVKRILITGGNIPWIPGTKPEAISIREFLVEFGVPDAAISVASASRNTHENALEIKGLMTAVPFESALLVTSAFHMPRALATFQKLGIPVTDSSTDVRVIDKVERPIFDWLPDSQYLDLTTMAVKEWVGYAVYALRGYL